MLARRPASSFEAHPNMDVSVFLFFLPRPDRQDADAWVAARADDSGPTAPSTCRSGSGGPARRCPGPGPGRSATWAQADRSACGSRCRCRLRLRHEPLVLPDRRTAGVEPGRRGRGLPRVRDSSRDRSIAIPRRRGLRSRDSSTKFITRSGCTRRRGIGRWWSSSRCRVCPAEWRRPHDRHTQGGGKGGRRIQGLEFQL